MRIVSIENHKDPATGKIDRESYQLASDEARRLDIAEGVYCSRCGTYLITTREGRRQTCGQCKQLGQPEELDHDKFIRCPECGHVHRPEHLYESGNHETICPECDSRFDVEVHVAYSFTSPRLTRKGAGEVEE